MKMFWDVEARDTIPEALDGALQSDARGKITASWKWAGKYCLSSRREAREGA